MTNSRINEIDILGRIVVYVTKTGLEERGQVIDFDQGTGVAKIRLFIAGPIMIVSDVPFSAIKRRHSWNV